VRNQVVDGVSTTEYSGVISFRNILALMPAADRKAFGSLPSGLRFGGPFRVWIDGRHFMRRIELRFNIRKLSIAVRVTSRLSTSRSRSSRRQPARCRPLVSECRRARRGTRS